MITAATKLISLLGNPLGHTFAPQMFNQTFHELGMDYFYFPVEVEGECLGKVADGIRCMNYAGFNVTKPNKTAILPHLDELDAPAEIIGSVNVVTKRNGVLKGYNTDGIGFVTAVLKERGDTFASDTYMILGAGGASRAISIALASRSVKEILIIDQIEEAGASLVDKVNTRIRDCARFVPFGNAQLGELLAGADVLVNATGVGMPPEVERTPVDKTLLHKDLFVVDITYNPLRTRLLLDAEERGCRIMNGIGMAIHQGIEGFSLMTDGPDPTEIMTRVMNDIAASRSGNGMM